MENHIKVTRAHRALSWLYGLMAILSLVSLLPLVSHNMPAYVLTPSLAISLLCSSMAILHYATARGARNLKPWANTTSKIIAFLMLIGIPVGTLIGIYLFRNSDWRLTRKYQGDLTAGWPAQTESNSGS